MQDVEEWVQDAQKGDRVAFARLVQSFEKFAVLRAFRITKDFHLAQDVAQNAFVIAFRKLETLRDPKSFSTWLGEVVRREAIRVGKKASPEELSSVENLVVESASPSWLPQHQATLEAIEKLPAHEQDVVVLFYLEGFASQEVSKMLQRPVGTVTKQLSRAIQRLKTLLLKVGEHECK